MGAQYISGESHHMLKYKKTLKLKREFVTIDKVFSSFQYTIHGGAIDQLVTVQNRKSLGCP